MARKDIQYYLKNDEKRYLSGKFARIIIPKLEVRARKNRGQAPRALLLKKHKTCCTTYKKICIFQKKVVPLHYETNT